MALNNFECNRLMPLHFKRLRVVLATVCQCMKMKKMTQFESVTIKVLLQLFSSSNLVTQLHAAAVMFAESRQRIPSWTL